MNYTEIEVFCNSAACKIYKKQYAERKLLRSHSLFQFLRIAASEGADAKSSFAQLASEEVVLRVWGEGQALQIEPSIAGVVLNRWAREILLLELHVLCIFGYRIKDTADLLLKHYDICESELSLDTLLRAYHRFKK